MPFQLQRRGDLQLAELRISGMKIDSREKEPFEPMVGENQPQARKACMMLFG